MLYVIEIADTPKRYFSGSITGGYWQFFPKGNKAIRKITKPEADIALKICNANNVEFNLANVYAIKQITVSKNNRWQVVN